MNKKIILLIGIGALCAFGLLMTDCGGKGNCKLTMEDVEEVWSQNATRTIIDLSAYNILKDTYYESGDSTKSEDFDLYLDNFLSENFPDQNIEVIRPVAKVSKPVKTVVYIDNTSSMKGYLNPEDKNVSVTDFVNVVNAINDYYCDKERSAMFVSQKGLEETSIDQLVGDIKTKNLKTYDAYPMNEFIDRIVNESLVDTAYSRISFFITDGIPSGSNSEISKDSHFNKTNAHVLETNIKSPLREKGLSAKGYGVAVYQFTGKFDGSYINYANNKLGKAASLKNTNRPFYVIALGDADVLKDFGTKAENGELRDFKPLNSLQAYTAVSSLSPTIVVPGGEGAVAPDDGVFTFTSSKSNPAFIVNLPLNQLPQYLRNESDLKRSLLVKVNGKDVAQENPDFVKVSGETATIPLNFTGGDDSMTLEISVRNELPLWVVNSTSHDDIDITNPEEIGKTFNLDVVVRGLLDGVFNRKTQTLGSPSKYTVTYEYK